MKQVLFFFFLLLKFNLCAQEKHEYFGALKLNGNDKTVISYRLVFTEKDGVIKGFSITDLAGNNETKNSISGSYNDRTKILTFNEDDILYTKSKFTEESFCFISFSGKIKLVANSSKIVGNFKGFYKNKAKCIDGTIQLIGSVKLYKSLAKINNKIQKSRLVDNATKEKVNPLKILDSLKINNMIRNQNLNVFVKSNSVLIDIWDSKTEDGDIINLYQNEKLILEKFMIENKKKRIKINLEMDKTVFTIEAINEGERMLNTAMIEIIDNDRIFELSTTLKTKEKTAITFIKN